MENLLNQNKIQETIQSIDVLITSLTQTKTQLQHYLNTIKEKKYYLSNTGSIEDQIKNHESILDKFEDGFVPENKEL